VTTAERLAIVGGHEDLSIGALADGRDYLSSAHAIRVRAGFQARLRSSTSPDDCCVAACYGRRFHRERSGRCPRSSLPGSRWATTRPGDRCSIKIARGRARRRSCSGHERGSSPPKLGRTGSSKVATPTANTRSHPRVVAGEKRRGPLTFRSSGFDRTTISRRRGRCRPGRTICGPGVAHLRARVALPPKRDSDPLRSPASRRRARAVDRWRTAISSADRERWRERQLLRRLWVAVSDRLAPVRDPAQDLPLSQDG
jgi:hypothetical protein